MNRRLVGASLLLAASACVSTAPGAMAGDNRVPSRIFTKEGTYDVSRIADPQVARMTIAAKPDAVWARLPVAYARQGLTVNFVEPEQRSMGTLNLRLVRSLGESPLSAYFDCGTSVGAVIANTHRLDVTIVSTIEPASGDGTILRIQTEAVATPLGTSGSTSSCRSLGTLEERLADAAAQTDR